MTEQGGEAWAANGGFTAVPSEQSSDDSAYKVRGTPPPRFSAISL